MKKQPLKIALIASVLLALALTFSCSSGGGGGDSHGGTLKKEKISGVSQKGPFVSGTVKLYELDKSNKRTGKSFSGTIGKKGGYEITEIKGYELASPYVELEATGKYINEITNANSTGSITLKAIVDVTDKDNVNINVLTHLEHDKVLLLVKKGLPFAEAKSQALEGVLAELGLGGVALGKNSEDIDILGRSPADSVLLLASVLLQGGRSESELGVLLTTLNGIDKVKNGMEQALEDVAKAKDNLGLTAGSSSGGNGGGSSSSVGNNGGDDDSSSSVTGGGGGSSSSVGYTEKGNDIANYRTVQIGEQVWMAENLDYNVEGSVCYRNEPANCVTYGRLYDWSTAMVLPSKCNSTSSSDAECAVTTPHKGICPIGWHIPSNAEWEELVRYVDGTNGTSSPYDSPTAGKYLKSKEGWDNCGPTGSGKDYLCEDTYGFSALPGGLCNYNGNFYDVGGEGHWWSSSESYRYGAYKRYMSYIYEFAEYYDSGKSDLFSVRCVKD